MKLACLVTGAHWVIEASFKTFYQTVLYLDTGKFFPLNNYSYTQLIDLKRKTKCI